MLSLSYKQLSYICQKIKKDIEGTDFISFLEKSSHKWVITLSSNRYPHLLICLKPPIGLYPISQIPKLHTTPFCREIEKSLKNSQLISCNLINEDRILNIKFTSNKEIFVQLFTKGANLYLTNNQRKIIKSFIPTTTDYFSVPPKPLYSEDISFKKFSLKELEEKFRKEEKNLEFVQEKQKTEKKIKRILKKITKLLEQLTREDVISKRWQEAEHDALLLQANFHLLKKRQNKIIVKDWQEERPKEIELNPRLTPSEQVIHFFKIAKKLKKREEFLPLRLQMLKSQLEKHTELLSKLEKIQDKKELDIFLKSHLELKKILPPKKKEKTRGYQKFLSTNNFEILVGKGAAENEKLTFTVAHGNDLWLHTSDFAGSHVILKSKKNISPDKESILDAAHLALFFSQGKQEKRGDIIITKRKFVSKVKGALGKVTFSKHKKLFIHLDMERIKRLKTSYAPFISSEK